MKQLKTGLRHDEYVKKILEERHREERKKDPIHESGNQITSPAGSTSTEEIRIFNEYMEQANLFNITKSTPNQRKALMLKRFFKMKRYQQVEIYSSHGEETVHTLGKVTAIGRDFVMLTNLKDRIWFPYHAIISANVPSGIPNYSNSHQSYIFDNDLKRKLLYDFGQTVSKRDALKQQFYEETLHTNLKAWKGIWVKVSTQDCSYVGQIIDVQENNLLLSSFNKKWELNLGTISRVTSLRLLSLLTIFTKK
ncbi:hypothetical protein [Metabacillus litoralis]|uniref:hypothetical protein n=1 Tax=Metabacillus litoralis TaxID=152268 RepID=UPI000EF60B5B